MESARNLVWSFSTLFNLSDIFWDNLTVREHLLFFARLRGIPITKEYKHVEDIISMVGLEDARRRYASQLSGGMKRRLSIATSLIGNPAVVFLGNNKFRKINIIR